MIKIPKLFKNTRIIILLVFLLLAVVAIHPNPGNEGVSIRSVVSNSSAAIAGIESPSQKTTPMQRERILLMSTVEETKEIRDVKDYYDFVGKLEINDSVQVKTNKGFYRLIVQPEVKVTVLNETVLETYEEIVQVNKTINGTEVLVNETVAKTREVPKTESDIVGVEDLGISVVNAPKTNLRKGLDLEGGTRVLLQPEEKVSGEDMAIIISNMKQRLNVFGLTDINVIEVTDLSKNKYILVEIAGRNVEEAKELLAQQGKFEGKIGNETVFKGGKKDITYVCRSADCAFAVDPYQGCGQTAENAWVCTFSFAITLSPESAQKQADVTEKLEVIEQNGKMYLSEKLDLYLDDELVDSLFISSDLKGKPATDISISGPGVGATQTLAIEDSSDSMKRLQSILITGSLPVKLKIVSSNTVSPALGEEFIKNAWLVGLIAILAVAVVISVRYRKIQVSIPVVLTMVFEIVLLLGFAAFIRWNLDLAAIAGIIVAAGTGVDHQIVIADEVLRGVSSTLYSWKEKIKKAFFIIMAAYFTTVVAMVPLMFAGAGLVKGFAFTTIVGVTFGVFVTRPGFAAMIEFLLRK